MIIVTKYPLQAKKKMKIKIVYC